MAPFLLFYLNFLSDCLLIVKFKLLADCEIVKLLLKLLADCAICLIEINDGVFDLIDLAHWLIWELDLPMIWEIILLAGWSGKFAKEWLELTSG